MKILIKNSTYQTRKKQVIPMEKKIRCAHFCWFLVVLALFAAPAHASAQETEAAMDSWNCNEGTPGNWVKITPNGGTLCGEGHQYWFWVRCGTVNKMVIFFQGGGLAKDSASCEYYIEKGHTNPTIRVHLPRQGIFNFSNSDNPFKDYNFVLLPYCSGDFHWGNKETSYNCPQPSPVVFQHRGFVNARAALDRVFETYLHAGAPPDIVLITGSSAGGYGSILHAPYIINRYPESKVSHLSDCAAGVIPSFSTFWNDINDKWGVTGNVPLLTPLFTNGFELSKMYIAIATKYPENMFSQFNFTNDSTQLIGFVKAGGNRHDFTRQLEKNLAQIHASAANFRSFTVFGKIGSDIKNHCILGTDKFYQLEVHTELGGQVHIIRFRDWVYQIAEDPRVATNVYMNYRP